MPQARALGIGTAARNGWLVSDLSEWGPDGHQALSELKANTLS